MSFPELETPSEEGLETIVRQKWDSLNPEMRVYYIQLFLLAAVQLIDAITHVNATQVPGAYERNPVIVHAIEQLGLTGFVTMKALAAITLVFMTELTRVKLNHGRTSPFINNSLRALNTLYALVCANNVSYLFIQK